MSDSSNNNTGAVVHNAPVMNIGQWNKNLTYWMADGSIVLRVKEYLYKIHLSTLTALSPNMASILAIPSGEPIGDPTQEGTELYPLHLMSFTKQEMDDFFGWTLISDKAQKERVMANLLKVAGVWEIAVGRQYAIDNLESMYLPPSRRLELARMFSIFHWVEPAVTEIFSGKLSALSVEDIGRVNIKVYSILVKGMERLEIEMRRTANVAPPMIPWDTVGHQLLHPDAPIKSDVILGEVKKLSHKDLHEKCRLDMVQKIEAEIVFVDKCIIAGVTAAIVEYYTALGSQ
ncbi:hypothetical protein C8F04DRAFT_1365215 [Mycena alexandri]|uniref:BTB domain-containing protein n=1 Tax=Mycena alexandri TaxID=1745969 RepID=A0AAD6SSD2_9AGAR|nr:hypothetical protein C8F04DRAFT_1365215 [Mycena alexandri]